MRQPITMEHVVGNKVLITLHRQAYELLNLQGIDSENFVALVAGVDTFGMWIENPNYTTVPVYTDTGEYIPPEERRPVSHRGVLLLQWPYIETVMQFPDRPAFRGGVDVSEIGFRSHSHREVPDG